MTDDDLTPGERIARRELRDALGDPPERFKNDEQLTVDDNVRIQAGGARPETDEYRTYAAAVKRAAGLEPDTAADKPREDRTVDELVNPRT